MPLAGSTYGAGVYGAGIYSTNTAPGPARDLTLTYSIAVADRWTAKTDTDRWTSKTERG